jgi:RNA polymerase sigma-70 factor (ECF subfamily)
MFAPDSSSFALELLNSIPSLSARARCLCRNQTDAQDLVQETLARALSHVHQFELGTNLRAWLQQILFHLFVSRRRRMLRERSGLARFAAENYTHETSCEPLSPSTTISPRLESALEELPPKIGDVIRKVDIEELSYREVAEQMSIPIGTVMSRLFRGRRRLAEAVADEMLTLPAQAA